MTFHDKQNSFWNSTYSFLNLQLQARVSSSPAIPPPYASFALGQSRRDGIEKAIQRGNTVTGSPAVVSFFLRPADERPTAAQQPFW